MSSTSESLREEIKTLKAKVERYEAKAERTRAVVHYLEKKRQDLPDVHEKHVRAFLRYVLSPWDESLADVCAKELLRHGMHYKCVEAEDGSGDWYLEYEWDDRTYRAIQGQDELGFHLEKPTKEFKTMLKFQDSWDSDKDTGSRLSVLKDILDSDAACYLPVLLHFDVLVDTWTPIYGKKDD